MQGPKWFVFFIVYVTFQGFSSSAASLENVGGGDIMSPPSSHIPSRGALLRAFLNYLFTLYPSSDTASPLSWDNPVMDSEEFTQGTPKRLYYAPRAGKRSVASSSQEDQELTAEERNGGTRWRRSTKSTLKEETEDMRSKRSTSSFDVTSDDDQDIVNTDKGWSWSKAVRRSPFSPRLGKRDDTFLDSSVYDDDTDDMDNLDNDDQQDDLQDDLDNDDLQDDLDEEVTNDLMTEDTASEVSPPRLMIRAAFKPRLGKKNMAFSPRLGKRGSALIPRLGKRGDFAFSPRLGKRGDFAFSPRLGKKADFAFSPRLGKRADFSFSPRLGKKADFAFSPRLGKRGPDFAFSPRLGKKADFAFSPRLGKREFSFSPRLGKRESPISSPAADAWRPHQASDYTHQEQRSVAFRPRLG